MNDRLHLFRQIRVELVVALAVYISAVLGISWVSYSRIDPLLVRISMGEFTAQTLILMQAELIKQPQYLALYTLGMIAVVGGILVFVFSRLSTALGILVKGAARIKKGDTTYRLPPFSYAEFDDVSRVINHLLEKNSALEKRPVTKPSSTIRSDTDEILKLKAQQRRLFAALDSVKFGIIITDVDNSFLVVNPTAESLFGISRTDLDLGRLQKIFGESIDMEKSLDLSRRNLKVVEHIAIPLKGKYLTILMFPILSEDEQKEVIGSLLLFEDVTEEKESEKMKVDFVSIAAHELRTPLTVIRGYTELLLKAVEKKINPEELEYIRRLGYSCENLAILIDNLLSVSRMERNMFVINPAPIDILEIIKDVVAELKPQTLIKRQKIEFRVPEERIPMVMADRIRIRQVTMNLVANAMNYTPTGGLIYLTVEQKFSMIAVSVIDNGPGIPLEAQKKLFSKFFRVSGVLERGTKGTGLGLYISKTIVNLHRGDITVKSQPGKGTTFTYTIPIATPKEVEHYMSTQMTQTSRHGIIINMDRLKLLRANPR